MSHLQHFSVVSRKEKWSQQENMTEEHPKGCCVSWIIKIIFRERKENLILGPQSLARNRGLMNRGEKCLEVTCSNIVLYRQRSRNLWVKLLVPGHTSGAETKGWNKKRQGAAIPREKRCLGSLWTRFMRSCMSRPEKDCRFLLFLWSTLLFCWMLVRPHLVHGPWEGLSWLFTLCVGRTECGSWEGEWGEWRGASEVGFSEWMWQVICRYSTGVG